MGICWENPKNKRLYINIFLQHFTEDKFEDAKWVIKSK